jgi:hypothetical protein
MRYFFSRFRKSLLLGRIPHLGFCFRLTCFFFFSFVILDRVENLCQMDTLLMVIHPMIFFLFRIALAGVGIVCGASMKKAWVVRHRNYGIDYRAEWPWPFLRFGLVLFIGAWAISVGSEDVNADKLCWMYLYIITGYCAAWLE